MKRTLSVITLLSICFAAPPVPATELTANDSIVNGSFKEPLATGWRQEARDLVGVHAIRTLKDGGVSVKKEMCGRAALIQDVKLPKLDVALSARMQFSAEATNPSYYAYAALVLGYLDQAGKSLGETRVYAAANTVPWKNSGTLHLIPVKELKQWSDTRIDLAQELKVNLKGIDPARVKALRITFESFGSGTDAC